jgi:nucleoside-triphosphatase
MMKILLTAPPGVGKSTVMARVVEAYKNAAFGIVAREILNDENQRIGFTSINSQGQTEQFMFRESDPVKATIGGEYSVSVEAIDNFVVPELKKGLVAPVNVLLYVDEIGRAQAQSVLFLETLRAVLDSPNNVLASIVYDDEPWSLEFKNRADIALLNVDVTNRSELPAILGCAYGASADFKRLSLRQQKRVYQYLKELVAGCKFDSATKIFTNALPYVLDGKIEEHQANQAGPRTFTIHGQTADHCLTYFFEENRFECDCDLSNGRGAFYNKPSVCSHQMSVVLKNLD